MFMNVNSKCDMKDVFLLMIIREAPGKSYIDASTIYMYFNQKHDKLTWSTYISLGSHKTCKLIGLVWETLQLCAFYITVCSSMNYINRATGNPLESFIVFSLGYESSFRTNALLIYEYIELMRQACFHLCVYIHRCNERVLPSEIVVVVVAFF